MKRFKLHTKFAWKKAVNFQLPNNNCDKGATAGYVAGKKSQIYFVTFLHIFSAFFTLREQFDSTSCYIIVFNF